MSQDRRDFLTWLGGSSLLGMAGASFAPRTEVPGHPSPIDEKWDMSWAERVEKARFRAVFDSPAISEGAAVFRAVVWCEEYKSVYGTARTDMAPVLVFRHMGISLAMGDSYWRRFEIGKENKIQAGDGKGWTQTNPALAPVTDAAASVDQYNLTDFISQGGIVLACNFAFGMAVYRYKQALKVDSTEARKAALEALIPGVILQPSGVFAVLRAQEAGCKYIMAS